MGYELLITEKPKAANKIASALAEGKFEKKSYRKVPYYEIQRDGKDIVVACAVGHLYTVAEKEKNGFKYPVFDIEWKPSYQVGKGSKFTKKYLDAIKSLCKKADSYTVATDYDIEGEVIGYNVVRFACSQKDANRMKFSTLTKSDLVVSYKKKMKTIDWGQANAGITRHFLDWMYGINLSRALTSSLKKAGLFKILSSGRVQGPALKIIVEKEKEIQKFVPEPYWQIELIGTVQKGPISAWHEKDKFWKKSQAMIVLENTKDKKAVVDNVNKRKYKQSPPPPFDLTSLQSAAYAAFRIKPKVTLSLAQNLYTSGYISYPRTSSQKLPPSIGYKKILDKLSSQKDYKELCSELLSKKLNPTEGKKSDPAHPAIYPTGNKPSGLKADEKKIYDLIVKRFLATFAEPALRQSMKIEINVNDEIFVAKGRTTLKKGWHRFYEPYLRLKENTLPDVSKGEDVIVKEIKSHEKETQPPKRYTQSSIITELSKRNLGTKSTRANIVDTLFTRGYVRGSPIQATKLGIITVETLEKYSPSILDEELTRKFEEEMEEIRNKGKKPDEVLDEAKKLLEKILREFKEKEELIGEELASAKIKSDKKANTIGECPNCGGDLMLRKGKYGQFVACNNYPDCKTTYSVPNNVLIKPTEKECEECNLPIIKIIKKGKKPQEICINPDCPSKNVEEEKIDKKCPKCGSDLVLRKSVYGSFYGCSNYPKCKYTEETNARDKDSKGDNK